MNQLFGLLSGMLSKVNSDKTQPQAERTNEFNQLLTSAFKAPNKQGSDSFKNTSSEPNQNVLPQPKQKTIQAVENIHKNSLKPIDQKCEMDPITSELPLSMLPAYLTIQKDEIDSYIPELFEVKQQIYLTDHKNDIETSSSESIFFTSEQTSNNILKMISNTKPTVEPEKKNEPDIDFETAYTQIAILVELNMININTLKELTSDQWSLLCANSNSDTFAGDIIETLQSIKTDIPANLSDFIENAISQLKQNNNSNLNEIAMLQNSRLTILTANIAANITANQNVKSITQERFFANTPVLTLTESQASNPDNSFDNMELELSPQVTNTSPENFVENVTKHSAIGTEFVKELKERSEIGKKAQNEPLIQKTAAENVTDFDSVEAQVKEIIKQVFESAGLEQPDELLTLPFQLLQDVLGKSKEEKASVTESLAALEGPIRSRHELVQQAISNEQSQEAENAFRTQNMERIENAVKISAGRGLSRITVQLVPENLGAVSMTVSVKAGIVHAKVEASTQEAHLMLMQGMESLRKSFEVQGIKLGSFEVNVGGYDHDESHNRESWEAAQRRQNESNNKIDTEEQVQSINHSHDSVGWINEDSVNVLV